MELSLRRWKPGTLLLGWAAYWVGLVGVTLSPAIRATWRATHLPEDHGSVAASFNNAVLSYSVIEDGVKTWAGSTPLSTALLWVAGPPLLLWVVWLMLRSRPDDARQSIPGEASRPGVLPPGSDPASVRRQRERDGLRADRGRVRTPNP